MVITEKKGFTLIEILIVVAIIAILASIVLVGLGPTQQSGRDARRLSDLHEVQNGLELYYNKCGNYPGDASCSGPVGTVLYSGTTNYYGGMVDSLTKAAIGINAGSLPQDPSNGQAYFYGVTALTTPTSYVLGAKLENGNNSVFTNYTPPVITGYQGDTAGLASCAASAKVYCVTL